MSSPSSVIASIACCAASSEDSLTSTFCGASSVALGWCPGMLLFPNPEMPYEVAATAWTQLMGCKSYEGAATLDAIRDFRDAYRGQGPENVPLDLSG